MNAKPGDESEPLHEVALPRGHSGREHVQQTGHRLAYSSLSVSSCAECDWSSYMGWFP